jgi:phosphinothricin acetyltransferase
MRKRIVASIEMFPWLVACDDDAPDVVLGFAYASPFRARTAYRFTVETSVYVAGQAHRQGVGSMLYSALLNTLREQGFVNAIAAITMPNEASIDLHESAGFQRAGVYRQVGYKLGEWHDVGLWQKTLASLNDTPPEPMPFSQVGVIGPS